MSASGGASTIEYVVPSCRSRCTSPLPTSGLPWRDAHRSAWWIQGPGADLFERDRVVLLPRCEERIPSRPFAQPKAQHSDVKRDGTVEASHLEMHVTETQHRRLSAMFCPATIHPIDATRGFSLEAENGSRVDAVVGGFSVIESWKFDEVHKLRDQS